MTGLRLPILALALVLGSTSLATYGAAGLLLSLLPHGGFIGFLVRRGGLLFALRGIPVIILDLFWISAGLGWGVFSYGLAGKRY